MVFFHKNYAHGQHLVEFCYGWLLVDFTHIRQGCFTGTISSGEAALKNIGK